MKEFLALFHARNKEFVRDRGSLSWNFLFPVMMIIGCAVAFSNPDTSVFKVGVHGDSESIKALPFMQESYVKTIDYANLDAALARVTHHQLDLLVSNEGSPRYWSNPASSSSLAAQTLFRQQSGDIFEHSEQQGKAIRYVDWVLPGILGMNIMFGSLFGVGFVIVRYRQNGVLKRLQATPVTPMAFIAAQLASRIVIVMIINALIFLGCYWMLDLLVEGNIASLLFVSFCGALAMVSLGLLIAARTDSEEFAGGLLNMATWPMMFLSEVWFSLDQAPPWLHALSNMMPLTHIVSAARAIMLDGATLLDVSNHLLWLAALCVVFMMSAAKLFRWHNSA